MEQYENLMGEYQKEMIRRTESFNIGKSQLDAENTIK